MSRFCLLLMVLRVEAMTFLPRQEQMRGVIWDVDGTLVDSFMLGYTATNAVLTKRGFHDISEDEYLFGCRYTTPERLARHIGLIPEDIEFGTVGADMAAQFDAYYITKVDTSTAPLFHGIRDILQKLEIQNRPMGALTNAAVDYAKAVLKVNALESMFCTVHGADDVPRPKPYPDGLLACCEELNIKPQHCVYIGDSPTDGAAARAAKFGLSIGVAWPGAANSESKLRESENFDFVVTSTSQLSHLLFPSSV